MTGAQVKGEARDEPILQFRLVAEDNQVGEAEQVILREPRPGEGDTLPLLFMEACSRMKVSPFQSTVEEIAEELARRF